MRTNRYANGIAAAVAHTAAAMINQAGARPTADRCWRLLFPDGSITVSGTRLQVK
ncbi:hypothetical protein ACR5KS_03900 [Leucobacter sp. W1153]